MKLTEEDIATLRAEMKANRLLRGLPYKVKLLDIDALCDLALQALQAPADGGEAICKCGHGVNAHGTHLKNAVCYTCECRGYEPKATPAKSSGSEGLCQHGSGFSGEPQRCNTCGKKFCEILESFPDPSADALRAALENSQDVLWSAGATLLQSSQPLDVHLGKQVEARFHSNKAALASGKEGGVMKPFLISMLGFFWWYEESKYFGWNSSPSSVVELFADGMALAFFALAIYSTSAAESRLEIKIGEASK